MDNIWFLTFMKQKSCLSFFFTCHVVFKVSIWSCFPFEALSIELGKYGPFILLGPIETFCRLLRSVIPHSRFNFECGLRACLLSHITFYTSLIKFGSRKRGGTGIEFDWNTVENSRKTPRAPWQYNFLNGGWEFYLLWIEGGLK